jgi:hypothetical protein
MGFQDDRGSRTSGTRAGSGAESRSAGYTARCRLRAASCRSRSARLGPWSRSG